MQNDSYIRVRLPADLKERCDKILARERLTHSELVRILYREMDRRGASPFQVETTARVLDAAE